jgi:hypothetical protein
MNKANGTHSITLELQTHLGSIFPPHQPMVINIGLNLDIHNFIDDGE